MAQQPDRTTLAGAANAAGASVDELLRLSREDLVELLKKDLKIKVMARNAIVKEWQQAQLDPGDAQGPQGGAQGGRTAAGLGSSAGGRGRRSDSPAAAATDRPAPRL